MSDVLDAKILSLERCLARIQSRIPPNAAALALDVDSQDIVALNLERAVQLCVDMAMHVLASSEGGMPSTMSDGFFRLAAAGLISETTARNMARAVGFRNISVHAYREIDWNIVYAIVTRHLDDFRIFARELIYGCGK